MIRAIKFGIFFLVLLSVQTLAGQDIQSKYLMAKEYLNTGEYVFAKEYFKDISQGENPFSEYAAFYYALSAYKDGENGLARSMWLQMTIKNKRWKKINEVYYWLSKVYFEEGNYEKGLLYANQSNLPDALYLKSQHLSKIDSTIQLEAFYYQYPNDKSVAAALAQHIVGKPISERNTQLLNTLVQKFDLNKEKYGIPAIGVSEMKEEYKVAVLLPFLFDGLNNPTRTARNKFIMDLYIGMNEAVMVLNKSGQKIKVFPYDTRRDAKTTEELLEQEEMKSMDLIIGPLFAEPIRLVTDFSYENKINMVNPLSTNSEYIRYNPYSFLFKPTIETQALSAAKLAVDSIKNKNAMIFYEDNPRDSLSAYTYSQRIQEAGFEVILNRAVRDTTVQQSFEMLTDKYEKVYTEEEVDSINSVNKNHMFKERKSIERKDEIVYYEEFFTIAPDSIGHIYIASSKPLFASNFISALEIRADSMKIIGRGVWKNFETLTFEEIERLGIYLIDPDYIDRHHYEYSFFRKNFQRKYKSVLSFNNLLGYEMMFHMGNLMKKHGNYFQNGTNKEGLKRGNFFYGTDFTFSNSNQYVPITILEGSRVKVINPIN